MRMGQYSTEAVTWAWVRMTWCRHHPKQCKLRLAMANLLNFQQETISSIHWRIRICNSTQWRIKTCNLQWWTNRLNNNVSILNSIIKCSRHRCSTPSSHQISSSRWFSSSKCSSRCKWYLICQVVKYLYKTHSWQWLARRLKITPLCNRITCSMVKHRIINLRILTKLSMKSLITRPQHRNWRKTTWKESCASTVVKSREKFSGLLIPTLAISHHKSLDPPIIMIRETSVSITNRIEVYPSGWKVVFVGELNTPDRTRIELCQMSANRSQPSQVDFITTLKLCVILVKHRS